MRGVGRAVLLSVCVSAVLVGCTQASAGPSTTAAPTTPTTSTTTTTTTTEPPAPPTTVPSDFAVSLTAKPAAATQAWTESRRPASQISVGDDWVAVSVYSDGRRRDAVLDLATGAERWSLTSTDSVDDDPVRTEPPLVIDGTFIHLERNGISDGAILQGIDVDTGAVLWSLEQPEWYPVAPFRCGPQRVCTMTWKFDKGPLRRSEYDTADGRLVAQGSAGDVPLLRDIVLVDGSTSARTGDFPEPPDTIPGQPSGFRALQAADDEAPMIVRFDAVGERLWQVPLEDLISSDVQRGRNPRVRYDEATNTVLLSSPGGVRRPDLDRIFAIDYETGEQLWTAEQRSFDCWDPIPTPLNVRCVISGTIDTFVDDDGIAGLNSYSDLVVTYQAFDVRSGSALGEVEAEFDGWDGSGDRPRIPSKSWLIEGGLVVDTTTGLTALSTETGETVPVDTELLAWCVQPPVDDEGEIFAGYFPCRAGQPEREVVAGLLPAMPPTVGAGSGGFAAIVTDGRIVGYSVAASPG